MALVASVYSTILGIFWVTIVYFITSRVLARWNARIALSANSSIILENLAKGHSCFSSLRSASCSILIQIPFVRDDRNLAFVFSRLPARRPGQASRTAKGPKGGTAVQMGTELGCHCTRGPFRPLFSAFAPPIRKGFFSRYFFASAASHPTPRTSRLAHNVNEQSNARSQSNYN